MLKFIQFWVLALWFAAGTAANGQLAWIAGSDDGSEGPEDSAK